MAQPLLSLIVIERSTAIPFKLHGHINRCNCVYWDTDNPMEIIDKKVNAPEVIVWAGIWSEGIIGPFFFDGTASSSSTWLCSTTRSGLKWGI